VLDIETLKRSFSEELDAAATTAQLRDLRTKYAGKKGLIMAGIKGLSDVAPHKRPSVGQALNEVRAFIEDKLKEKEAALKSLETGRTLKSNALDVTLPGRYRRPGGRHPVSVIMEEVIDVFTGMGFSVEEGPEVETDYYNFEALNMPQNHPARDMQDTFYVDSPSAEGIVLRTHTSPVQIHVMQREKPPLMFIAPGKVYRCDADITHTPLFHQVEGMMLGVDVTFSNLKAVLSGFLRRIFSADTPVRFRPSFFPFTEPSTEVDMGCIFCAQNGCRVCKGSGWLEILGAGMVNPKVLRMAGIDPDVYTGFAFGMGIERIAMLKFGIDDLRLFYEGDLRFLRQFK
jgi:phenylalanyl-tRNA synthetase alpha chain